MDKHISEAIEHSFAAVRNEIETRERWLRESIIAEEIKLEVAAHFKTHWHRLGITPEIAGMFSVHMTIRPKLLSEANVHLRELAKLGWRRDPNKTEPVDSGLDYGEPKRTWYLVRGEGEKLNLHAEVAGVGGGDDVCHVEKVGSHTTEVPTYKIVCPDDEVEVAA